MAGADCHLTLRASTGVQFPARSSLQFRQAQFHCGNPPPAADPSILICTSRNYSVASAYELISHASEISSKSARTHSMGMPPFFIH